MSGFTGLFSVRDYRESDKNFILSTFLKGLYYGNQYYNMIDKRAFMDNYKHVATALLASGKVRVACLPDDPDIILGYAIMNKEETTIAWTFVKSAWRQKGVCKALITTSPKRYMHFTDIGLELIKKWPNCVFDPFTL